MEERDMQGSRRSIRTMSYSGLLTVATLGIGVVWPQNGDVTAPDPAQLAYHLRVVRVTGEGAWRGAALGCGSTCGKPIVLPSEEAWGTTEQLANLARALGGERADAVTGFIVLPEADGEAWFDGTVYPGDVALQLRFAARAIDAPETRLELQLEISSGASEPPLAEVRLLAAPERTVAIATPSLVEGEWVVLAVTTLDPRAAEERAAKGAPIENFEGKVTYPVLVQKVAPEYPPQARADRREGDAILQAVIDVEGAVRALRVLRVPPGSEDFAAAAVEAVQHWRYSPALAPDGRPVPVYFTIFVQFKLH
jgi:TonB family protein